MGGARKVASVASVQSKETKGDYSGKHRKENGKVHFATLTDVCHLKEVELEPKYQKNKGCVVLQGDIVMDD